jgi:L-malate glycosyltransferase
MKHILYVLPYMNLGGTEKQAFSLMNNLQQRYHMTLLAPDGLGAIPFRQAEFDYHEFPRLDQDLVGGLRQFRQSLQNIHRQQPIDLVHVHAAHELMLLIKLFLPQVPIVFTVHGYHGSQSSVGYWLASIFGNLFAQQVIAVSQSERDILAADKLQSRKTNLVYNGVAEPQIDPQQAIDLAQQFKCAAPGQITLGTAARLSEAKGLEYLIVAMSKLVKKHPNIKLVIAGDGELKTSLQQMVHELGLDDYVVFAGYVQDVHHLMYSFDIFVLPSLQEAMPLACIESMALKKPVVGTSIGGIPEQVMHEVTGFIVPPKDPDALANSLDRLISDPNLLASFAQQGYKRYREKFALAGMLNDTVEIYEKAMKK